MVVFFYFEVVICIFVSINRSYWGYLDSYKGIYSNMLLNRLWFLIEWCLLSCIVFVDLLLYR